MLRILLIVLACVGAYGFCLYTVSNDPDSCITKTGVRIDRNAINVDVPTECLRCNCSAMYEDKPLALSCCGYGVNGDFIFVQKWCQIVPEETGSCVPKFICPKIPNTSLDESP